MGYGIVKKKGMPFLIETSKDYNFFNRRGYTLDDEDVSDDDLEQFINLFPKKVQDDVGDEFLIKDNKVVAFITNSHEYAMVGRESITVVTPTLELMEMVKRDFALDEEIETNATLTYFA